MTEKMKEEKNGLTGLPQPGQGIASLRPEERRIVNQQIQLLLADDLTGVIRYGTDTQGKIADLSGALMKSVDSFQVLEINRNLTEFSRCMDKLGLRKAGWFDRMRSPKALLNKLKKNTQQYKGQINGTLHELDKNRIQLMKNLAALAYLYDDHLQLFRELTLKIIAGEELLRLFTQGAPEAERVTDRHSIEQRVSELKITHSIALQMTMQMQLMQENEQRLAEKIQSSLLHMVPLWQMQVAQRMLLSEKQAAEQQDKSGRLESDRLWHMGQEIAQAVEDTMSMCQKNQQIEKQTKTQVNVTPIGSSLIKEKD